WKGLEELFNPTVYNNPLAFHRGTEKLPVVAHEEGNQEGVCNEALELCSKLQLVVSAKAGLDSTEDSSLNYTCELEGGGDSKPPDDTGEEDQTQSNQVA